MTDDDGEYASGAVQDEEEENVESLTPEREESDLRFSDSRPPSAKGRPTGSLPPVVTETKRPGSVPGGSNTGGGTTTLPPITTAVVLKPQVQPSHADRTDKADVNLAFGALEARWVLSVLDDAAQKLSLLSYLTPDILHDPVMDTLDQESHDLLHHYFDIERKYQQLVESPGFDPEVSGDALSSLDSELNERTRSVARLLKSNAALSAKLRDRTQTRAPATLEFINTFARLRKVMYNKLKMTAEEERAMRIELTGLRSKESEDTHNITSLTDQLERKRAEHRALVDDRDKKIARLRKQIEDLVSKTESDRKAFEQKMREESDADLRAHEQRLRQLQKDMELAVNTSENEGAENYRKELQHHRKQALLADQLEEKIQGYDRDLGVKHSAFVDLTDVYAKETADLKRLTEYFAKVDAENDRINQELRTLRQNRDKEVEEERRKRDAGLLMANMFNSHQQKIKDDEIRRKKAEKKAAKEAEKNRR